MRCTFTGNTKEPGICKYPVKLGVREQANGTGEWQIALATWVDLKVDATTPFFNGVEVD